jgi:hypothetical protein
VEENSKEGGEESPAVDDEQETGEKAEEEKEDEAREGRGNEGRRVAPRLLCVFSCIAVLSRSFLGEEGGREESSDPRFTFSGEAIQGGAIKS